MSLLIWPVLLQIDKNFALISPDHQTSVPNSAHLGTCMVRDSCSSYQIHTTGRRGCAFMLSTLNLLSRQDLFARIYNHFCAQTASVFDTVLIEVRFLPLLVLTGSAIQVALDSEVAKYCLCICANQRRVKMECNKPLIIIKLIIDACFCSI